MSARTEPRIRWGILATGGIAHQFTRDLQLAGLEVTAVGSRDGARAAAFAREFGLPRAHGSIDALVHDPQVDVVYVANPHPFHAAAALAALRAGKHVLVEKSFTLNAAEADELVAEGAARGLVVQEAMWTRFLPHMCQIRALIADGAIGDPQLVLADHTQALPTDPAHRLNAPELGGGALLDLGIYPISFGIDLFGLPERVISHAALTETGVDRRVSGTLVHEGGRHTVFSTALDLAGPNRATVLGTDGSIEIDPVWYAATGYTLSDRERRVVRREHPVVVGRGMQYQALEVERVIREGALGSPLLPPTESADIMRVLDGIRREAGLAYPGERAPGVPANG